MYAYDGNGAKVWEAQQVGATTPVTTVFLGAVEITLSPTGRITRTYYFVHGQRSALREQRSDGIGVYFLHGDALGSASLVTGLTGTVVSSLRYTPYGLPRGETGRLPTPYRYTGQRETGVGFYDYQARLYDPYLNRWIQPDSIIPDPGNPQALNRYSYVYNNPLKYIDANGHHPLLVVVTIGVVVLKAIDYGWTAYDMWQSGRVLNDPSATRGDKLMAGLNVGLAFAFEAVEPDDLLPVGLPLDDVGRRVMMKGVREAYEQGGEKAVKRFLRDMLPNSADDIIQHLNLENIADDVALGINDCGQLSDFARKTNSYWYGEWEKIGLADTVDSWHFESGFKQAMDRAGVIHFSLDGIYGSVTDFANLGGKGDFGQVPWTARELYLILQNPEWLAKTVFYQGGQIVPSPFGP